jgi:toxin ParE1/3/4
VSKYQLSNLAELDLADIADYTTDVWGAQQAKLYIESLVECFTQLVNIPGLGRLCHSVHADFRRIEHKQHVIFYGLTENGIFISRILHQRMLPSRHALMEGEDLIPRN